MYLLLAVFGLGSWVFGTQYPVLGTQNLGYRLSDGDHRVVSNMSSHRVPPSPSVYWNVQVSGKLRFDPWAAISYGQNLRSKRVRDRKSLFRFAANAPPGPPLAGQARSRPFSRDGFSKNCFC